MLTKTFGRLLTVLSLVFLSACTKAPEEKAGERLTITVRADGPATKTVLSDDGVVTSLAFTAGDQLGFFADGIISNIPLDYVDDGSGIFIGQTWVDSEHTEYRDAVDYYAYYPYSEDAGEDLTALKGFLPPGQKAPFDSRADYLVADPVTDDYFVENFPQLSFEFNTHLFAIVKLSVTNSNPDYADEKILSIGLKSTGHPLAGAFTFDAEDGSVTFTDDPNYLSYAMDVVYDTDPPVLGTDTEHSVYAVVNPANYASGTLSMVVRTTNYTFTIPSTKVFRPRTYQMTALSTADVASSPDHYRHKRTLVLWGDSITSNALLRAVQAQLGGNWEVVRGGVAGDSAQQVASRQGGLPMYTQSSDFEIPASSEQYVPIEGVYWYYNGSYGQATHEWTYKPGYTPLLNPIVIQGVECEISWDSSRGKPRLRRLVDGEPVMVPARSSVSTYGSRAYADADAIVVYVGTNGRPSDTVLMDIQDRMKNHLTKPYAQMFVLGFHQSTTDFPVYWTQQYVDSFTGHYGEFFIDQRTMGGGEIAIPLMKEIGQITDESEISETDWTYINRGDWPLSWFRGTGDVHPNDKYGAKVQAILLRRRMAELGLL